MFETNKLSGELFSWAHVMDRAPSRISISSEALQAALPPSKCWNQLITCSIGPVPSQGSCSVWAHCFWETNVPALQRGPVGWQGAIQGQAPTSL